MTDNKSGPVKPPVIDLSANPSSVSGPSETAKPDISARADDKPQPRPAIKPEPKPGIVSPAAKSESRADSTSAATSTTPSQKLAQRTDGGAIAIGIVGGGVLGLAAAYGLAAAGLWPAAAPIEDGLDQLRADAPQISELVASAPQTRDAVAELLANFGTLNAEIAALAAENEDLRDQLAQMPTTAPDGSIDLTPLETRLSALEDGAGPSDSDAELVAALDTLSVTVDGLETLTGTQAAEIERLATALAATEAALSGQPADLGAAVQLPLILGGLESAFAAGQPFLTEIDVLRRTVSSIEVSPVLLETAGTGLPDPQSILAEFGIVLPAMLSGRPGDPDAPWQDATLDWVQNVLALRPAGEIAGDDPTAVVSRLEAAMARRDFLAADELFALLPTEMRDAAGTVPDMVAMHADAARLIETVRRTALENSALTAGSAS